MTEPAAKYEAHRDLPCPFCGSANLRTSDFMFCDDDGEYPGIECLNCDAGNRLEYWNNRPDPWRYPPDMPEEGQQVVLVYQHVDGGDSLPISTQWRGTDGIRPIVRWTPIPAITDREGE